MNDFRRMALLALLRVVAFSVSSCASPKIVRFDANPNRIRRVQRTTLSWSVKGTPVLEAEPALADIGPVSAEGSLVLALEGTTVFTLRVTRGGKEAFARQEVVVYQTAATIPMVVTTEPDPDGGLIAATTAEAQDWDATLAIATATNASDRAITVKHGGREVDLAVGEVTDALAGLTVGGVWELEISVYDCDSEDLIFSSTALDTICPGTVVEEPAPDEVDITCTTEVDANSYTIQCEGSQEAIPGCTVTYVYDATGIREGDSYAVTSISTFSYDGDCFDLPDVCQRVEVTGTRSDASDDACPTTPVESESWSAVKSIYR